MIYRAVSQLVSLFVKKKHVSWYLLEKQVKIRVISSTTTDKKSDQGSWILIANR